MLPPIHNFSWSLGASACYRQMTPAIWRHVQVLFDAPSFMSLNRDQELWAMALWVERHHGKGGWFHIAQQQDRLLAEGDLDGVALWREVAKRFDRLAVGDRPDAPH